VILSPFSRISSTHSFFVLLQFIILPLVFFLSGCISFPSLLNITCGRCGKCALNSLLLALSRSCSDREQQDMSSAAHVFGTLRSTHNPIRPRCKLLGRRGRSHWGLVRIVCETSLESFMRLYNTFKLTVNTEQRYWNVSSQPVSPIFIREVSCSNFD
jgi:hypothetical protein